MTLQIVVERLGFFSYLPIPITADCDIGADYRQKTDNLPFILADIPPVIGTADNRHYIGRLKRPIFLSVYHYDTVTTTTDTI